MTETRTITATYRTPDDQPQRGTVTCRMTRWITDPDNDGVFIGPGPLVTHLTEDGDLSVDLIASDDPTVAWMVREDFPGGRKFWVAVPLATPDPCLLSDLPWVAPDDFGAFVPGPEGPPGIMEVTWTGQDAWPTVGTHRWYASETVTVEWVRLSLGVAPTLADVVADINRGTSTDPPTTIFVDQDDRPRVPAGASDSGEVAPTVTPTRLYAGDYLTVDIDEALDGSGITVQVRLREG